MADAGGLLPHSGDEVGSYRLEELLGRGGAGSVYAASDGERRVAVKLIDRSVAPELDVDQILREAMVSTVMRHPNLVPCLSCGATDYGLYLVYELLTGGDTKQLVDADGPLDEYRVLTLLGQTAAGLQAIHEAGYVHGDIKPSNVLLDEAGVGRIGDFGTADLIRRNEGKPISGTPAYMAPEQATGGDIGAASDLYSLGASAFFWTTGRAPFTGSTVMDTIGRMLTEPPPDLRALRPELSPGLAQLIGYLLRKDARERYPSARALVAAVAAVQAGDPPTDPLELRRAAASSRVLPVTAGSGPWPKVAVAALLVLAVAVSALWWRTRGPAAPVLASNGGAPPVQVDPRAEAWPAEGIALPWVGERSPFAERGSLRYREAGSVLELDGGGWLMAEGDGLSRQMAAAGSFRIELRVRSHDLEQQGPAVLLLLGRSHATCNLLLGQSRDRLDLRCRTTTTNPDGTRPNLSIPGVFVDDRWRHVVIERIGERNVVSVDGTVVGEQVVPGDLRTWDLAAPLTVGDSPRGGLAWSGELAGLRVAAGPAGAQ